MAPPKKLRTNDAIGKCFQKPRLASETLVVKDCRIRRPGMLFGGMKTGRRELGDVTLGDIQLPLNCHSGVYDAAEARRSLEGGW